MAYWRTQGGGAGGTCRPVSRVSKKKEGEKEKEGKRGRKKEKGRRERSDRDDFKKTACSLKY